MNGELKWQPRARLERGRQTGSWQDWDPPEHEVHELKALALQEALPIGAEHQAGTEGVKQVLHHFLLLSGAGVVSFKYLPRRVERSHQTRCPISQRPTYSFQSPPRRPNFTNEALASFQFRATQFSVLWALNKDTQVHIKTLNTEPSTGPENNSQL